VRVTTALNNEDLEKRHYQDLVGQALVVQLRASSFLVDVDLVRRFLAASSSGGPWQLRPCVTRSRTERPRTPR
jgi:hypothetical protein